MGELTGVYNICFSRVLGVSAWISGYHERQNPTCIAPGVGPKCSYDGIWTGFRFNRFEASTCGFKKRGNEMLLA